jgi:transcriptional regulator with XRE-family HTH domain
MVFEERSKEREAARERVLVARLRQFIEDSDLSFYKIASRVGASGGILSMWLAGTARPRAEELAAIEKFLPPWEIFCASFVSCSERGAGAGVADDSPFGLRIQAFDLLYRHDLYLWLAFAKSDCPGDADGFPLDHGKSLIGCYRGPGCNESGERLVGYPPPKLINAVPSELVVTETTRPRTSTLCRHT